jgi:ribosome biogenesis GTPase
MMIDLINYGYNESYIIEETMVGCIPARVTEVHRDLFKVVSAYGECNARMKGSFYNKVDAAEDFPAVGDFVLLRYNEIGDSQIVRVCPRRSKFSRPDYSGHSAGYVKTILEQVVAANFDYVFILASLNYDFNVNRILRYITVAWESGGTPVVLLTKADLVEDYTTQLELIRQQAIGVPVYAVSAVSREGIEQLQQYLEPKKTLVFLGSSGVGKSTMVNALAGEDIMNVSDIRVEDSKGRHTTTHRQLTMLKNGVMIIDTPGMRELGMWDVEEGLGETFSDIEELFTDCRFSDCTHHNEPGCAIMAAIADGSLEHTRWKNYIQLKGEARFTEDRSAYLREKREFFKKIEKSNRARQKVGGKL